ncbi:MAG: pyridoxal phosphate-dependent class II aminotransferase [Oscillospiraceae bacterium]|nr:pyridoxal phosphate-dependent class II aminotransferase [Oscillospiraceae bacterium]
MVNEHGGDIYGRDIKLDFSANLNPLGMPENVKKAAAAAIADSGRYPDPYCRELTKKLSVYENTKAENIVCGNGADDLIYRIVHALRPRTAIIAEPSFSEYAKALREVGCMVTEYEQDDIPAALNAGADMLILCSPDNPTGRMIPKDTLGYICRICAENGTVFLCDECFIDLCENGHERSARQFMNENIIVLKAFTKTYAMAGLRLGYAISGSTERAAKIRRSGQFWSVSTVAQAAGIAALGEREYIERARRIISEERKYLSDELGKIGFEVYPSDANYILFRCKYPLDELLLKEGILIRNCNNYSGLGNGYFRTAVRLHEENAALIEAIERVTKWQKT